MRAPVGLDIKLLGGLVPACVGCRIGVDYPAPLVDHAEARLEYLDLGKQQEMR